MEALVSQPGSVHFAGYRDLSGCIRRRVRITNVSSEARRLRIETFKKGSAFRAAYAGGTKRGAIAPGLSETVVIEFRPEDFIYQSEILQVHCQGDDANILKVPIHAYPTLGLACPLPNRLDFGKRALGDVVNQSINLQSSAPIDFEYKLEFSSDTQFCLQTAKSGVVPADGIVPISIRYAPVRLGTARANLVIHLAQLDTEPHTVQIAANCAPGRFHEATATPSVNVQEEQLPGQNSQEKVVNTRRPSSRTKNKRKKGENEKHQAEDEFVDGLHIPKSLDSQWATNYILAQRSQTDKSTTATVAKMPSFCASSAFKQESTLSQHDALMTALHRPYKDNGLDEFNQELALIQQREKELEFRASEERTGERLLTEAEVRSLGSKYKELEREALHKKHEANATRRKPELSGLATRQVSAQLRKEDALPLPPPPQRSHFEDMSWRDRRANLRRLIVLTSRLIVRLRADKRLKLIQKRLSGCTTREQVRALVDTDNKEAKLAAHAKKNKTHKGVYPFCTLPPINSAKNEEEARLLRIAHAAGVDAPKTVPALLDDDDISDEDKDKKKLLSVVFPKFEPETSAQLVNGDVLEVSRSIPEFDDTVPFELEPWPEPHEIALGRSPHPPPDPNEYFEADLGRDIRHGAFDDSFLRPPRGESRLIPLEDPGSKSANNPSPRVAAALAAARARWFLNLADAQTKGEMPSALYTDLPLDTKALGVQRADLSLILSPPAINEAHRDWPLLPRPIERPPTAAGRVAANRHYWIMAQAYRNFPTPSSVWRKPYRRASALSCLADYHKIQSWHPPPLLPDAPIEPLSDSESDDDDEAALPLPTIQDTADLVNQRDEASEATRDDEKDPNANVVSDIPRDRARLDLYRAHVNARREAEGRLKSRLDHFFHEH